MPARNKEHKTGGGYVNATNSALDEESKFKMLHIVRKAILSATKIRLQEKIHFSINTSS